MPTIGELTKDKSKEKLYDKVFHKPNACPICGGKEFLVNEIYETSHKDEKGNAIDCVDFKCTCESSEECSAKFTMVFKIECLKTIEVVKEES